MASTLESQSADTQQVSRVSAVVRSIPPWVALITALVSFATASVGLVKSYTTEREVFALKGGIPRVCFSLVSPESRDEFGERATVSGMATPGSMYKYVFIGTRGDQSTNPNWRIADMVQVRIDGEWSGTAHLRKYPIDGERDIHVKAVLTAEPDSYRPQSFIPVFPRHGDKQCVESDAVIIRRVR